MQNNNSALPRLALRAPPTGCVRRACATSAHSTTRKLHVQLRQCLFDAKHLLLHRDLCPTPPHATRPSVLPLLTCFADTMKLFGCASPSAASAESPSGAPTPAKPAAPVVLGYWAIRGLIAPCRNLCSFLGVPFTEESYVQGPAPDFDRSSWLSKKATMGECGDLVRGGQRRGGLLPPPPFSASTFLPPAANKAICSQSPDLTPLLLVCS